MALASRTAAELPEQGVATTINNYCVSGLTAIFSAAEQAPLRPDLQGQLALAGGVESMSQVSFLADRAGWGER